MPVQITTSTPVDYLWPRLQTVSARALYIEYSASLE